MKIIQIKQRTNYCKHPNIEVDVAMRQVTCTLCSANVDPIEWILRAGYQEATLMERIKVLKEEVAALEKQRAELKAPRKRQPLKKIE